MVNIYDNANEMAALLKQTEQYKEFQKIKSEVMEDEANKKMISGFKKLQFEAQAMSLSGQEPPKELMEKIQKLGEVLQFNPKITEFFTAEYRFNTLVSELYNIIFGEVSDLGAGLFDE